MQLIEILIVLGITVTIAFSIRPTAAHEDRPRPVRQAVIGALVGLAASSVVLGVVFDVIPDEVEDLALPYVVIGVTVALAVALWRWR
jgi:uncharacterized membrane protein YccC